MVKENQPQVKPKRKTPTPKRKTLPKKKTPKRKPPLKAVPPKKKNYNFNFYINKVLKQIHPNLTMNSSSMKTVNFFITNMTTVISKNILGRYSLQKIIINDIQDAVVLSLPEELVKHGNNEGIKASKTTLIFPINRIENIMSEYVTGNIDKSASIYMAAVIEYLVTEILELSAEILELSGNASEDLKKKRISNRHILLAMKNDEELKELLPYL